MTKENLTKLIRFNVAVSEFNSSLAGMSIWMMIGMMNVPIYASMLKISSMVSGIMSGWIQQKMSASDERILLKYSFNFELLSTTVYSLGNMIIPFNFTVGMSMLLVGRIIYSIMSAIGTVHHDRVLNHVYEDVCDRSNFKGSVKMFASAANTAGLCINTTVMALTAAVSIDQVTVIKYILFIHGVMGVIDMMISITERKAVSRFYDNILN